jgi:predicted metal-binding protein
MKTSFHARIVHPVIDIQMRDLCKRPYHGHPVGCPNYGKRSICPPESETLDEYFDLAKPVWALWMEFDIAAQAQRMQMRHSNWNWRQLVNCRYWQGTVRKALRTHAAGWMQRAKTAVPEHADKLAIISCPEAMGVNVTETMANIGIKLEWPPKQITRLIYLVGVTC